MHSESTSNADSGRFLGRLRGSPTTSEEPIVAGRLDWVATVPREQLAELATRSRTLAGTARTRVPVVSELPSRRFRRTQPVPSLPEPESTASSTPWMLIAVVAALVSVLVFVAARRSRQGSEDEIDFDVVMERDILAPEHPHPMHTDHDFDAVVSPNP